MKNRFKNYGLWVSIFAFIPLFCEGYGINVLPDNYNLQVKAFLGILVLAGVISNPDTKNIGYLDDKEVEGEWK